MIMIHVPLPIHFVVETTPRSQDKTFLWAPLLLHTNYLYYMMCCMIEEAYYQVSAFQFAFFDIRASALTCSNGRHENSVEIKHKIAWNLAM